MKITHLIFSLNIGGTENMLIDILNEQINHVSVELIVVNSNINPNLLAKLNKSIPVYLLNRKEGGKNPLPLISLNIYLLRSNPDIIHCHNHNIVNLLWSSYRKKSILTVHTTDIPVDNFKKYRRLFAISHAVANDIKNRSALYPIVIMNGIDFNRIDIRGTYESKQSGLFKLVQVGRLDTTIKGHHLLINAIHILGEKGIKNIHIDFIGEGKSLRHLQRLVNRYALEEQVTFLGSRTREYIYKNLKFYDLLIQPSLYEGFGLTIVEAMAAKIPVLVSDIDGPMEVIQSGKYGFFFKVGDVNEIVNKVQFIMEMNTENLRSSLVEPAYEYAKNKFGIKETVRNYLTENTKLI